MKYATVATVVGALAAVTVDAVPFHAEPHHRRGIIWPYNNNTSQSIMDEQSRNLQNKLPSSRVMPGDITMQDGITVKTTPFIATKGHRPLFDALMNTEWADLEFNKKMRDGEIESIHFDENLMDAFGSASANRQFRFYEDYPLGRNDLPVPLGGYVNKTSCCSLSLVRSNMSRLAKRQNALDTTSWQFPLYPEVDSFYLPLSALYSGKANGHLIAYRQVGFDFWSYISGANAYQMSYKSQSSTGADLPDVATIFIPPENDNLHTVVYLNHEDGKNLRCATSFSIVTGLNDTVIETFMEERWAVLVPDYEGITSAFTASVRNARATLDGIRASLKLGSLSGYNNREFLLYGYSAGSSVASKTAELIEAYAPELNMETAPPGDPRIIALAVGGFSVNATATSLHINKGPWAGFVLAGSLGLGAEYPNYEAALLGNIDVAQMWTMPATNEMCADLIVPFFASKDVFSWFAGGEKQFVHVPQIRSILDLQGSKLVRPPVPVMVFQSMDDESAPPGEVLTYVDWACQQGVRVEYHEDRGYSHLAEENTKRFAYTLPFFHNVIKGITPKACANRDEARV